MAAVVAIAALAFALPTGANAVSLHSIMGHERSVLAAVDTCDAPRVAPGKGCVFLSDCAACSASKCVANYDTQALDDLAEANMDLMANDTAICAMIASTVATATATDQAGITAAVATCPNDTTIDAAAGTVWTTLGTLSATQGTTLDSAVKAKTYLAEKCATNVEMSICASKGMSSMMELQANPSCINVFADESPLICRTDPIMVNETCAMGMGEAMSIEESVMKALRTTALDLHTECQKLTTEADCHAFDGSTMLKTLNETNTKAAADAILASAEEQVTGYGLVTLMALMSMLMF